MKPGKYIAGIILVISLSVSAQYSNVQIGGPLNAYSPNEPSVAINPLNPDEIVVGANINNSYFSVDGGMNWQHEIMISSYGVNCDPVSVADTSGNFYYIHPVPDLSRLVCQKKEGILSLSSDGTFTAFDDYSWYLRYIAQKSEVNPNLMAGLDKLLPEIMLCIHFINLERRMNYIRQKIHRSFCNKTGSLPFTHWCYNK